MRHKRSDDRARKVLDEAFECQRAADSASVDLGEYYDLCSNPAQYNWRYAGRKEMLVPYNGVIVRHEAGRERAGTLTPQPNRWEIHRVWIVEGVLRRGESNILQRRCFYIDEESWLILLGEGYDIRGTISKYYLLESYVFSPTRAKGRWYDL